MFYDELGRITNRAIDGVAQTVAFDALGRVTTMTNALGSFTNVYVGTTGRISTNFYPNGQQTVLTYYDKAGDHRLQQIQNLALNSQLSTFSYSYDSDGQIKTWTQQADTQEPKVWVAEYDPVDQLLGVTVRSNTAVGAILKQFIYSYDKAGNRTGESIHTSSTSSLTSATHNDLNQLTTVSGGGPVRFSGSLTETGAVTVAGSRASMTSPTNFVGYANLSAGTSTVAIAATDLSLNTSTNRYQLVITNNGVSKTLSYDLNGNLTSTVTATSTNTLEWDAVDRLVRITQLSTTNPQLVSEFTYDGQGRRIRIVEKSDGVVQSDKRFLWVGTDLAEERDSTGATVTKRFFGQGQQNITLNPQPSAHNLFYTFDHLGSVREMTDATGAIRARYEYDPYGRRTKAQGDLESDFGFTGHYCHAPSGLHLAVYRAYDADTGRWLSRDPIGERGGLNLYGYTENSPIVIVDPNGTFGLTEGMLLLLAAGIIVAIIKASDVYDSNRAEAHANRDAVECGDIDRTGTMGQQWVGDRARQSLEAGVNLANKSGLTSISGPPFQHARPSGPSWQEKGNMYFGSALPKDTAIASVSVKAYQKGLKVIVTETASSATDGQKTNEIPAYGSNPEPGK